MRKFLIGLTVALLSVASLADQRYVPFRVVTATTNGTATQTVNISGQVEEVWVQTPSLASTGNVWISYISNVWTGTTAQTIYSNATLTATAFARPRVIPTGVTGSALSTLTVAERILLAGDPVTLRVVASGVTSNVVWRGWLKVTQ